MAQTKSKRDERLDESSLMDSLWMLNKPYNGHQSGKIKTKKEWLTEFKLNEDEWKEMSRLGLFRQ